MDSGWQTAEFEVGRRPLAWRRMMEATRTIKETLCSTGPEGQPYALDEIIQELQRRKKLPHAGVENEPHEA